MDSIDKFSHTRVRMIQRGINGLKRYLSAVFPKAENNDAYQLALEHSYLVTF